MINLIPFPRRLGPARPKRRGRPPKNQPPQAKVISLADRLFSPESLNAVKTAFNLYIQASRLDESADTQEQAIQMYEQAIALDPYLSIAYTNLGNIHFHQHRPEQAETLYRKALAIDPHQPEALYNLGYILSERDAQVNLSEVISLFRQAVTHDPSFADAHFNLARAIEQSAPDNPLTARATQTHWKAYLRLEPKGTWSEIARRHLDVASR